MPMWNIDADVDVDADVDADVAVDAGGQGFLSATYLGF